MLIVLALKSRKCLLLQCYDQKMGHELVSKIFHGIDFFASWGNHCI